MSILVTQCDVYDLNPTRIEEWHILQEGCKTLLHFVARKCTRFEDKLVHTTISIALYSLPTVVQSCAGVQENIVLKKRHFLDSVEAELPVWLLKATPPQSVKQDIKVNNITAILL